MMRPDSFIRSLLLPIVAAALLLPAAVQAAVVNAASCNQADVQAAIDAAGESDIVAIPAGTCTWQTVVKIGKRVSWTPLIYESKALTLRGAGIDQTIIVNEVPRSADSWDDNAVMAMTVEGKPLRITELTFRGGTAGADSYSGTIRVLGATKGLRIDHVKFHQIPNRPIAVDDAVLGVIDHCEFDEMQAAIMVHHSGWGGLSWGDGSWNAPLSLGSSQAIYIEDNTFRRTGSGLYVVDCEGGGRYVFRHNSVYDGVIGNHGTESPGRYRSCFSYEIYNNTVGLIRQSSLWTVFHNRGGTGVMFDNVITGNYSSLSHVAVYRGSHAFNFWGACDGTSPYDVNSGVTYDTGTHTGADGQAVLTAGGKGWAANQWVGYSLHNTTQGKSSVIVSNTADTISVAPDGYAPSLSWNTGDSFRILKAEICLDQVGRSTGNLLSNNDPPLPQAWPQQILEPFYEWNNTIDGADTDIVSDSSFLRDGRDYYNDTARPGYTPYTYPHPLMLGGDTLAPAAPTNLAVQ